MNDRGLLFLNRTDVEALCTAIDTVAVVERCLLAHQAGTTVLPAEAYLAWSTPAGGEARSINMPGLVPTATGQAVGTKIINANPANPETGRRRASGLIVTFDPETAEPLCVMEGGHISALRTASVSVIAARLLGSARPRCLAIIGAGELGSTHAQLLVDALPSLDTIALYDIDRLRAEALAQSLRDSTSISDVRVCDSARDAISGADIVVPTTTTVTGYIERDWLQPGTLLINVSLDDPLPEVFLSASKVVVDDWPLVSSDTRRILGRLHAAGRIGAPGDEAPASVYGELGAILAGTRPGRESDDETIVFNPFGMAIEDVALASEVYAAAIRADVGTVLPR